jgi:hypothetical protein
MSMGELSTFCSLRQSLSSVVCSSSCRGHLHPLFNLFLDICFFEAIVNGIVFINSFSICSLLVYQKTTDFCMLILYPATSLKLFKVSGVLWWSFLGLWDIGSCHMQIRILWLFLYLFVFHLFILLDLLLWLGILGLWRVGILVLFLTLGEMVSVFPH